MTHRIEPVPGEPGWTEYARRMGQTPDVGYDLYSAAQPGQPQGTQVDVTGNNGADLGYRAHEPVDGWHVHAHASFGDDPDAVDGLHEHLHQHRGDAEHGHIHVTADEARAAGWPVPDEQDDSGWQPPAASSGMWADQATSSSDRRGTSPRERAAYLADLDRAGLAGTVPDDDDCPAHIRAVVDAERLVDATEADLRRAKDDLMEARSSCTLDGTVSTVEELADGTTRRVNPVLGGRVLSTAARARWVTYSRAADMAARCEAAYDSATARMSRALAEFEQLGLDSPTPPLRRGRSFDLDDRWDGLSAVDRNRR
jgi:hypothetical protein